MFVIGTAGHVDHGKSTLVKALTGIDPDRWEEEKEREMTIDLGFAWVRLGDLPEEVGIVDVPGHRDFIENMLAGVGGIDVALLVIAGDEGVMPQTREHLAILDLLQVQRGVIAITKTDLVEDPEWLELIQLDVADTVAQTVLADAPLIPVSARTGDGLDALQDALVAALESATPRADRRRPRLPVDRVFTLSGFGTIVTGTLLDGSVQVGDEMEIQPAGLPTRVRGLQTHNTQQEVAHPGRRVAINLTGVDTDQIARGDVVAAPGVIRDTILCDVAYRHLPQASKPLKHNVSVKLFVGAAEVVARTRILGADQLAPGENGWLQLALREPLALLRGDRFILRRPSPPETIGGGQILDPHPGRRHRRFRAEVIEHLETLAQGTPEEQLLQVLARRQPLTDAELRRHSPLPPDETELALRELEKNGELRRFGAHLLTEARTGRLHQELTERLQAFHSATPLRLGMSREELRSRLRLPTPVFNGVLDELEAAERVHSENGRVRLADHAIRLSAEQVEAVQQMQARFSAAGVNSPSVKAVRNALGEALYLAALDLERFIQLNEDVVYDRETFERLKETVVGEIRARGAIDAAGVRDLLDTSRKYAIALLETLDEQRVTRRVGDRRELRRR